MNTLFALLCLLTGSALTLVALSLAVNRGVRQLAVASAYRDVAQVLGLQIDTRGVSVHGFLGERRIWIGEVMEGYGTERRVEVRGVLALERPLGLGLTVKRRGRANRLLRRHRGAVAAVGEPELDKLLQVHADEPERVRGLFVPEVRDALRVLTRRVPELVVTDEELQVWLRQPPASTAELHGLVDAMVRLADTLEGARREVGPPAALQPTLEAWHGLGRALSLDLEPSLPALEGHYDGHRVLLATQREAEGYSATLQLWFHAHPELGLLLRPQVEPDGYWSVGQDIQVGDVPFDDAFVVKGWDPTAVSARLGVTARERLLDLRRLGRLVVDDRGLVLRGLPLEPAALAAAVRSAANTARALGW